ncbi:MAG: tol-pal system protein YbgF [Syntrophobacterales bacterium]|nr:MAG: tol-pal system protein YbgF [Syntrophobacterales bacterium]
MKNLAILFLAVAFTCTGCATQEELYRAESHLGSKITAIRELAGENRDLINSNRDLINSSRDLINSNRDFINSSRKIQADVGADLEGLRDSVQKLRGATEKLDVQVSLLESKTEDPRSALNDISSRLTYLENYLGIGKTEDKVGEDGKVGSPEKGEPTLTGREEAYANAYSMFKSGRYEAAREEFQKFLKAFPDSEFSDNAQFWIGECDYFKGKYEEAIIEYEAVIKNYPTGNKVPNALLKQALSFLKLGDKSSAKLLLQGVIKDYPNTTPASVARKKLIDIK